MKIDKELMDTCKYCIHNKVCPNDTSIIQTKYDKDGSIDDMICPDMLDEYDLKEARENGIGNTVIELEGCDDSTIFAVQITADEFDFLRKIAKIANSVSKYGCMPRMYVKPATKENNDDVVEALCKDCIWYSPFENAPGGECVNPEYDNGSYVHFVKENNWCFSFRERSE